jgi:hypothetical protein
VFIACCTSLGPFSPGSRLDLGTRFVPGNQNAQGKNPARKLLSANKLKNACQAENGQRSPSALEAKDRAKGLIMSTLRIYYIVPSGKIFSNYIITTLRYSSPEGRFPGWQDVCIVDRKQ